MDGLMIAESPSWSSFSKVEVEAEVDLDSGALLPPNSEEEDLEESQLGMPINRGCGVMPGEASAYLSNSAVLNSSFEWNNFRNIQEKESERVSLLRGSLSDQSDLLTGEQIKEMGRVCGESFYEILCVGCHQGSGYYFRVYFSIFHRYPFGLPRMACRNCLGNR